MKKFNRCKHIEGVVILVVKWHGMFVCKDLIIKKKVSEVGKFLLLLLSNDGLAVILNTMTVQSFVDCLCAQGN